MLSQTTCLAFSLADEDGKIGRTLNAFFTPRAYGFEGGKLVWVGIVWVVMAPAREKARQAVCLSNLTQIGHAFRMYRDDWDGVEPQKRSAVGVLAIGAATRNTTGLDS